MMGAAKNLIGLQFTELTVIERAGSDKHRRALWKCRCSCGVEVIVPARQLIIGSSKSCGHRQRNYFVEHGYRAEVTHGMSKTKLYGVWCSMCGRCNNPTDKEYPNYGGRGISVCPEWNRFEPFRDWALQNGYNLNAKFGECTLERNDVNGNYCPENCRWASSTEQANNKRSTVYITHEGITRSVAEWGSLVGIRPKTIKARLKKGWTPEQALTTPVINKEAE